MEGSHYSERLTVNVAGQCWKDKTVNKSCRGCVQFFLLYILNNAFKIAEYA